MNTEGRPCPLTAVRPGERLVARSRWRGAHEGIVESVAPHLGVLWLHCGPLAQRKLVDVTEYQLFRPYS